jgi:hypothetical protein
MRQRRRRRQHHQHFCPPEPFSAGSPRRDDKKHDNSNSIVAQQLAPELLPAGQWVRVSCCSASGRYALGTVVTREVSHPFIVVGTLSVMVETRSLGPQRVPRGLPFPFFLQPAKRSRKVHYGRCGIRTAFHEVDGSAISPHHKFLKNRMSSPKKKSSGRVLKMM